MQLRQYKDHKGEQTDEMEFLTFPDLEYNVILIGLINE